DIISEKTGQNGYEVFQEALSNVKPQLEVRSRRVGGVTYQVPVEVRPERMQALAVRWMVRYARERKEKGMASKLAAELMDAQKGQGGAVKKRDDTRRMAEANRAFSHYRW
ncbi:MAG: 30S ribosomal protein S7, partial [Leptospiraceae bacterium]|nr:30S ribosomal protein S7 [Leptospiraceae bacterium]